jgi:hypothetical protein
MVKDEKWWECNKFKLNVRVDELDLPVGVFQRKMTMRLERGSGCATKIYNTQETLTQLDSI